jgi:hypothetical protein
VQSYEYAHALISNVQTWQSEEAITNLAGQRATRLGKLSNETGLWFVLDEAAVRRVIGSRQILHEQLTKLLTMIGERRIRLGVVPEYAPQHPGLSGSFRLVNLKDGCT